MAHGSWLKAHGSCPKARGSRPRKNWCWAPQAPRPWRHIFLGLQPRALRHEPWNMRHEPVTINNQLISDFLDRYCVFQENQSFKVSKFQDSRFPKQNSSRWTPRVRVFLKWNLKVISPKQNRIIHQRFLAHLFKYFQHDKLGNGGNTWKSRLLVIHETPRNKVLGFSHIG